MPVKLTQYALDLIAGKRVESVDRPTDKRHYCKKADRAGKLSKSGTQLLSTKDPARGRDGQLRTASATFTAVCTGGRRDTNWHMPLLHGGFMTVPSLSAAVE